MSNIKNKLYKIVTLTQSLSLIASSILLKGRAVSRILLLLLSSGCLVLPVQAKESIKLSAAQYRIFDGEDSHSFTPIGIKYSTGNYNARIVLPYIEGYRGQSGLGNVVVKLSYLTQWKSVFVDFNFRQKLATADEELTLPVSDRGGSIELSHYLYGGIVFAELGHIWRSSASSVYQDRADSFYYALGGMYPMQKKLYSGLVFDHRITALGRLDHIVTGFLQYKWSADTRIGANLGKGLKEISPNWIAGLTWSSKY